MRKSILIAVLTLGMITAKAQTSGVIEYKPIPLLGGKDNAEKVPSNVESSIIDAYYINTYTNKPTKIKLKVVENKYGVFIIACKRLAENSWADLSKEPIQVAKLSASHPMAEYFEYKGFISRLQQSVYF